MEIFGITLDLPMILIIIGILLLIISIIMGIIVYSKEKKEENKIDIDKIQINEPEEEPKQDLSQFQNTSIMTKEPIIIKNNEENEEENETKQNEQDIEVL